MSSRIFHDAILIETVECLLGSIDLFNAFCTGQQVQQAFFDPEEVKKLFESSFTGRDFNRLMSTSFGRGYLLGYLVKEVDSSFQAMTEEDEDYRE